MSNIQVSNSNLINVSDTPTLPNIGYYDKDTYSNNNDDPNINSYNVLYNNLEENCKFSSDSNNLNGIYNEIPNELKDITNINKMDVPYYFAKLGKLDKNSLKTQINKLNRNNILEYSGNQIQYLVCQLINARNRYYNATDFVQIARNSSLYGIFEKFGKNLVIPLCIIFIITIYFLVSGMFSSIDISSNIINIIQNSGETTSVFYWLGILFGLIFPAVCIIFSYNSIIKQNLKDLEKDNITNNPYGEQTILSNKDLNIDYLSMILIVVLIFTLIGVLFTIRSKSFGNIMYVSLTSFIFILISLLIFVMYYFIPYYNTAELGKLYESSPNNLQLFIDVPDNNKPQDVSFIYSNQTQNNTLKIVFTITAVFIFILTLIFINIYSGVYSGNSSFFGAFFKGMLGSSAILIIPILWVINILIGIQYFYIYPIFLILIRFLRYLGMLIIYMLNKNKQNPHYSDDLKKTLDNFQNYSSSWGFFGIEELKNIMAMAGFENLFSKSIIPENNNSNDISNNKFISSALLGFFVLNNNSGIAVSILFISITLIISIVILFVFLKIQNIYK